MIYLQVSRFVRLVTDEALGAICVDELALEVLGKSAPSPELAEAGSRWVTKAIGTYGFAGRVASLLISETSCEQHNDFLDRTLLVPTVENLGCELFGSLS